MNPQMNAILSLIGQGGRPKKVEDGIFISKSFSFGNSIIGEKDEYFDFGEDENGKYLGSYGVCDSIEQVKEAYAKWFNDEKLRFCVSFTSVKKSEQPADGGWRWHKWGEYIGDKDPQHEYLYDEEGIEEVFVYHIYKIS
jgi:hypothetical protein